MSIAASTAAQASLKGHGTSAFPLSATYYGDGAVRVVQQCLADRAEQQSREAAATSGTGHDQL
ncbi:hypothetical protein GCM10023097_17950 [Streptomyces collinus]